ncbi:group I truncated hemoglobin [Plantactinospora endophytica]|uniref:Group 1 truncated hemoglobin n=1 Tax=Plantactinospora endophytica TaxID=673535 RepID=A0ABQ4EBT9_9ACTN|nr:group 1 truncated hemoglobin [Plantactinospora endophytica]GIG92198.1 group 1 truncated hemoglobin GlbN [Plantactinospora endophytica]
MSIYDRIGGAESVRAAVEEFYSRVLADPELKPFFAGVELDRLKSHQRAFIAAALGGPEIYAGRDMTAAHAGLDITDGAFDAVVAHLAGTLADLGVSGEDIAEIATALTPLRSQVVSVPELAS